MVALDLILFMIREAKPRMGRYNMNKLWEPLDPEDCDEEFRKIMKSWVLSTAQTRGQ